MTAPDLFRAIHHGKRIVRMFNPLISFGGEQEAETPTLSPKAAARLRALEEQAARGEI
jgi:hypothetical protein